LAQPHWHLAVYRHENIGELGLSMKCVEIWEKYKTRKRDFNLLINK